MHNLNRERYQITMVILWWCHTFPHTHPTFPQSAGGEVKSCNQTSWIEHQNAPKNHSKPHWLNNFLTMVLWKPKLIFGARKYTTTSYNTKRELKLPCDNTAEFLPELWAKGGLSTWNNTVQHSAAPRLYWHRTREYKGLPMADGRFMAASHSWCWTAHCQWSLNDAFLPCRSCPLRFSTKRTPHKKVFTGSWDSG